VIGDGAAVEEAVGRSRHDVVDYLARDFQDVVLFSRINTLVRLKTMQDELDRRRATAEKYGIKDVDFIEPPGLIDDAALVVLGAATADRDAVVAAIGEGHARLVTDNRFEAEEAIIRDDLDGLVILAEDDGANVLEVCGDFRHNPRLFNLPIVVVTRSGALAGSEEPYRLGASDVFTLPLDVGELNARIESLVAQQRYRLALRRLFPRFKRPLTCDGLTGVYSHGFMNEHLSALVADAGAWNKPLTVAVIDVVDLSRINTQYGYAAGDKLLRQVGTMMRGMIRGEDLCARSRGDEFVFLLPETPVHEAEIALKRIVAVVTNTEFAVADMEQPMYVQLKLGTTSLQSGDTTKTLLARARESMR
jgi:two-component system cell cycle response regulator